MSVPLMPKTFFGPTSEKLVFDSSNKEYSKTSERKWTKEEEQWCLSLKEKGFSYKDIAVSVNRDFTSVALKMKRLGKKNNSYNKKHVQEKYHLNNAFLEEIQPDSVLDVFCGSKKFYSDKVKKVVTNDADEFIEADYNLDALKLLCLLYYQDKKFDLVDLDPFGSAYDCFDLAIKMARKGLVITLGEMGHLRFKRLDFVSRYYGIDNIEEFSSDTIIEHIQKLGLKNKKELVVFKKIDWNGISRVWFYVNPIRLSDSTKKLK